MKEITVMVTGSGAPGTAGTIYSLRNNYNNRPIRIITVDINKCAVGKYLSDCFYVVPRPDDNNFVDTILSICLKEKVDVILPSVTRELPILASAKDIFLKKGVKIAISSPETIELANNKALILETFSKIGYPNKLYKIIRSTEELISFAENIGYPETKFVVKLPVSNGMRGLRIISNNTWNLERFRNEKPDGVEISLNDFIAIVESDVFPEILATEYLPGDEYSVDIFRSVDGSVCIPIPRRRDKIRSGITFEGTIMKNDLIVEMSKNLADKLALTYAFGFQFKYSENGKPIILECNPRLQGTMVMSTLSGVNIIYLSVLEALGENISNFTNFDVKWGMNFKRYWGGIATLDESIIGRV